MAELDASARTSFVIGASVWASVLDKSAPPPPAFPHSSFFFLSYLPPSFSSSESGHMNACVGHRRNLHEWAGSGRIESGLRFVEI